MSYLNEDLSRCYGDFNPVKNSNGVTVSGWIETVTSEDYSDTDGVWVRSDQKILHTGMTTKVGDIYIDEHDISYSVTGLLTDNEGHKTYALRKQ